MVGYIYRIWNDINDKDYIGKTAYSLEQRWKEHKNDYKTRRCEKRPLYDAMNKYGIEHFHIELVEECPLEELSSKEIYWIGYYHSYENGYNATRGGDGTFIYDYDYIVEQYKKGLFCQDIAKELQCDITVVSNAIKKAGLDPHYNIYKKLSNPIRATFKDNTIKDFESITEAAKWLMENEYTKAKDLRGVVGNIGRVAKGKTRRKSYLGIKWSFINN